MCRLGRSNQIADALSRLNLCKTADIAGSISLTPETNLLEVQRKDSNISKVIQMKELGLPKPPLFV